MTISRETITSDIYAGKVLCTGEGHRHVDTHLAMVHHGYDEDAYPLDDEDRNYLEKVARTHDRETGGRHNIRILYVHP